MSCMDIIGNYRIKLQYAKAMFLSLFQAVAYQFFTDMNPPGVPAYCIAGIADVTASADIAVRISQRVIRE